MEEKATLNLYQKLARIRKISDVVSKSKKGYNYSYADISDILAKVKAGMERLGVSLVPTITPGTMQVEKVVTVNTKLDRQGKSYDVTSTEYMARAEMVFVWVDDETGMELEVPWNVVGAQTDPSQAFGSGLTYCTRYFLTNFFQIPQVETDVDEYRSKQREAEAAEDLSIAKSIIDQLDTDIRIFLSDNQNKKDEVAKLVKKYVKSGDYTTIKNPELAAKLLGEFREKYVKEQKD